MFIPISIFEVQEAGNKVDDDSLIYDSYYIREDKVAANFQKDLLISRGKEDYQQ